MDGFYKMLPQATMILTHVRELSQEIVHTLLRGCVRSQAPQHLQTMKRPGCSYTESMPVSIDVISEGVKASQALPHRLTPGLTTRNNLQRSFDLPLHDQPVGAFTVKGHNII
ncbi:hypothetical protein [Streptomyces sp. NPDC057325]|uniref:hypothetical protein n=1 Tax=unclassified Streptomyces TaxID=2593676 RepID=UPI00362B284E